jgi:GT2 family glycosyltransferase
MIHSDVGVVAIGRNEGERLIRCLTSIKSEADTIVYVDSGSTDTSTVTAERIGAHVVRLDSSKPFTAARARNEGAAALKAICPRVRLIQFIDGDCILVSGWLDKAYKFLGERKDVAVVCGRRRELFPTASVYNQLCDIEWDTPIGETKCCGGDALIRVEAFEAAGGFQAKLIAGEEPELCVRLREIGWKIWRLDAEMTLHDAAMTRMQQFWSRSIRCGYAYAAVSRLHRGTPCSIWQRETARAVFWGGLVPVVICFGSLIHPAALAGLLTYFFQICRMSWRRPSSFQSWTYALLITIAKFPEFQGILKFYWRQLTGQSSILIEYK